MKINITALIKSEYKDLIDKYESETSDGCPISTGTCFTINKIEKPNGLCASAWETMLPFIIDLFNGKEIDWMKNKKSALISCNDGFRPISFLIEVIDE